MNKLILIILLSVFCITTQSVFARVGINQPPRTCQMLGLQPSLIIKFKNKYSSYTQNNILSTAELNSLAVPGVIFTSSRVMSGGAFIVFFSPAPIANNGNALLLRSEIPGCLIKTDLNRLIFELKNRNENIEYLEPNILLRILQTGSSPSSKKPLVNDISNKQWDLLSPPGGVDVTGAWALTQGSSNATVAVIDTGKLNNDSLNPNAISGVHFTNNGSFGTGNLPSCGSECVGYEHGTHVAGTVAASGISAYGETIFGMAPTAKILPVNVFSKFNDGGSCFPNPAPCLLAYTSDIVNGINWVGGNSFPGLPSAPATTVSVNMSLGGMSSCGFSTQQAVNQLLNKNIAIAVAAGNSDADAIDFTPANCVGVIAIASTGPSGFRAFYSNFGSTVKIAAPGGDSSDPATYNLIYSTVENGYAFFQGTSMASPHVAGLLALMYSLDPTLTPTQALSLIQSNASPFPSSSDPEKNCLGTKSCGAGIINANLTVTATKNQAPTLAWVPNVKILNVTNTSAKITWNAANWQPTRSTPIAYTVNINNFDSPACTNITTTVCKLFGLFSGTTYNIKVRASDPRNIYPALVSPVKTFTTTGLPFTAPTLTSAKRKATNPAKAFIFYSKLGSTPPNGYYTLNGVTGAVVKLDSVNKRFVAGPINTQAAVSVTITVHNYSNTKQATSNAVMIPAAAAP